MSNYYLNYTGAQLDEAIGKVLSGDLDIPITELATPTINIDANGLITVTIAQSEGYVSAQNKTTTYQLPTHNGGEYDAKAQTINVNGKFMTGNIVIFKREPTYKVEAISGASYGFSLNSSGYYESQNKGINSSYAICRVQFDIPESTTVHFDCINYAENNYDYGIIGNLDTALALSASADSSCAKNFKGSNSSSVQTFSMSMSAGTHYVDVKFIKDSSQSANNDSLQFKIRFA